VVLAAEGDHPPPGRPLSPRWPGTLTCPSARGELHADIISRPRLHRGQPACTCRRRSPQAWPPIRDVTSARATHNGHCGRHRMGGRGPVPSCVDEWYEREEPALPLPPSLTAAGEPRCCRWSGHP
jgi:hypothetical protein